MNRGVGVAEKRAMLEAAGEPWPVCDCHGEPKAWHKDSGEKAGGFWRCSEKGREINRRYKQSENGREVQRKAQRLHAQELLARGLCTQGCGRPLATADSWRCNECLDKKISPLELLKSRRRQGLARMAARHQSTEGV